MVRFLWLLCVAACTFNKVEPPAAPEGGWANVAPAEVQEVLSGDGRLYLRIVEGRFDFWVAVAPMTVSAGDHVLMGKGPERRQFLSKDLARRFKVLTFIEDIAVVSLEQSAQAIRLAPSSGGLSIEAVFGRRVQLDGQSIEVRGRVVKVNRDIFDKHWYHLVDGTGVEGTNDLTVTSTDDAQVGDVVTAKGRLVADKDLGFGYRYDAILEDAALTADP